jgi:hypothetical protein
MSVGRTADTVFRTSERDGRTFWGNDPLMFPVPRCNAQTVDLNRQAGPQVLYTGQSLRMSSVRRSAQCPMDSRHFFFSIQLPESAEETSSGMAPEVK